MSAARGRLNKTALSHVEEAYMPALRLDRILASSGTYTRSESASLIRSGRVTVGGKVALSGAAKFDPETECIQVDGDPVIYKTYRYFMLNKPKGFLTATVDSNDRTVIDLLDKSHSRLGLFPVGRLDKDVAGLLLLTNDGGLAHKIASPASSIDKMYHAKTGTDVTKADIEAFAEGLVLNDGTKCLPARLRPIPGGAYITLREGKYHQVKRMMAAIGKPVRDLVRVSIGGLVLGEDLSPGEYREIGSEELCLIFNDPETKK